MNYNTSILLLILLAVQFASCNNKHTKTVKPVNKKALIIEATLIDDTPMMLGTSVYKHLNYNKDLSVFNDAITENLSELLIGTAGPYTLFIPTDSALKKTEIKDLDEIFLKQHIVKGNITTAFLVKNIRANNGVYKLISLAGKELVFSRDGMKIIIETSSGSKVSFKRTDYLADNGVVHTIEGIIK